MYIEVPFNHEKTWVYYTLTTVDGDLFHAGICEFRDLTLFRGVVWMNKFGEKCFLSVIDHDDDRLKLANRALSHIGKSDNPKLQWNLHNIITSWNHGNKKHGKPVECVETGEIWPSASACSDANRITYTQLISHLREKVGYKTVKGKKYRYI